MQPAVTFDRVSKKFRRGERHDSLRDLLPAIVKALVRQGKEEPLGEGEFWAVEDVSFSVNAGEGLAIIGPNGAGKSTVLKLLIRLLKPNRGTCSIRGRAAALIEVAGGFHPDLTGRENVFLQGAIMGMKRSEIVARFDEILDFAGLAAFIDTPVKRYSSGMNARLGFSIAAHLEPDVLVIDEILSVGDVQFQQRCIERLHAFKSQGVAVVFVSHNLQAVATHFEHGLLLDRGRCQFAGKATDTVTAYAKLGSMRAATTSHNARASIVRASLHDESGAPVSEAAPGDRLYLNATFRYSGEHSERLNFGLFVTDPTTGIRLYNAGAHDLGCAWRPGPSPGEVTLEFQFRVNLLKGTYHLNVHVSDALTHQSLDRLEPAAHLTVHEDFSVQGSTNLDVSCRRVSESKIAPVPVTM